MDVVELRSGSPEQTRLAGRALGALLRPGDVLALAGELGAGKTELVRGIARALGIDAAEVRSPTFTLVNRYEGAELALVHVDAYRLTGACALVDLGYEEVLDPEAAVAIEWSPRVEGALPEDRLTIGLEHITEEARRLRARAGGARSRELLRQWSASLGLEGADACADPPSGTGTADCEGEEDAGCD